RPDLPREHAMTRRTILVLVLAALLVGVAAGALAAAHDDPAPSVTVGTPLASGASHIDTRGPVRIVLRTPDPHGGPPWAVRTFAMRMPDHVVGWSRGEPRPRVPFTWHRCAQLGRVVGGTFGWIRPGETTLHPLPLQADWLTQCE